MIIDFSKVKDFIVPEGKVTNIADTSGRVLWSAVKPVTVKVKASTNTISAKMTVDGETYNLPNIDTVLTVNAGTELVFTNTGSRVAGDVSINHADGTKTTGSFSKNGGTYGYTVIGNTDIAVSSTYKSYAPGSYDYAPVITITEIPEGQILFTISGDKCFADEGMTWGEYSYSEYNMPNGTPLYIYPTSGTSPVLYHATGTELVLNGSTVFANETIVAFGAYTFKSFD